VYREFSKLLVVVGRVMLCVTGAGGRWRAVGRGVTVPGAVARDQGTKNESGGNKSGARTCAREIRTERENESGSEWTRIHKRTRMRVDWH